MQIVIPNRGKEKKRKKIEATVEMKRDISVNRDEGEEQNSDQSTY